MIAVVVTDSLHTYFGSASMAEWCIGATASPSQSWLVLKSITAGMWSLKFFLAKVLMSIILGYKLDLLVIWIIFYKVIISVAADWDH